MCAQTPSAPTAPTALSASSTPTPSAWFGLCHCPHLAALGWGFPVFYKYLEASNVCPNPFPPHRTIVPTWLPLVRVFTFFRSIKGFQCVPKPPPPPPPPPPPSPPPPSPPPQPSAWFGFSSFLKVLKASTALSASSTPTPSALCPPTHSTSSPSLPHRSPPSLLCHCPHLAALGSVSAIVPTWLPLVGVFQSFTSI